MHNPAVHNVQRVMIIDASFQLMPWSPAWIYTVHKHLKTICMASKSPYESNTGHVVEYWQWVITISTVSVYYEHMTGIVNQRMCIIQIYVLCACPGKHVSGYQNRKCFSSLCLISSTDHKHVSSKVYKLVRHWNQKHVCQSPKFTVNCSGSWCTEPLALSSLPPSLPLSLSLSLSLSLPLSLSLSLSQAGSASVPAVSPAGCLDGQCGSSESVVQVLLHTHHNVPGSHLSQ